MFSHQHTRISIFANKAGYLFLLIPMYIFSFTEFEEVDRQFDDSDDEFEIL